MTELILSCEPVLHVLSFQCYPQYNSQIHVPLYPKGDRCTENFNNLLTVTRLQGSATSQTPT